MNNKPIINATLVRKLVDTQFPQWKSLEIKTVTHGGWDNRTFHLGNDMLVRLPSDIEYVPKVVKEQHWLPLLAPQLPLPIPSPLAMGKPGCDYPWNWSIYRWIDGENAAVAHIVDLCAFAKDLAHFLTVLQQIDTYGGPTPGPDTTSRGGPLKIYDDEVQQALAILKNTAVRPERVEGYEQSFEENLIDIKTATAIWQEALATTSNKPPVWVHGDISADNLLVKNGKLSAVIDFGGLVVGDPACDLAIAWTFLRGESREVFKAAMKIDDGTWARGRGWALWKALIIAAGLTETNATASKECWRVINEIIKDYAKQNKL